MEKKTVSILITFSLITTIFILFFFLFKDSLFIFGNKELAESVPDFRKSINLQVEKFTDSKVESEESNNQEQNQERKDAGEEYDLNDAIKYTKRQEEIEKRITSLVINTEIKTTVAQACDVGTVEEVANCKKDLFVGCANSLYLGFKMTQECHEFLPQDYDKYLALKNANNENASDNKLLVKDIGEVYVSQNPYTSLTGTDQETINSSELNTDYEVQSREVLVQERNILEPLIEDLSTKINYNTFAKAKFQTWVSGWATLFATNGGNKEAGQVMNKYTAFGYNPYLSKTCIVSLPYKTVDKFFGTTLDKCVKQKNITCIQKIKSQVKDRAIEVVMIKNGKRAIFPLGDFGPAEWTGNAIDFTKCSAKVLGATGKDLVIFRPL
jgi:hypothetical protein